MTENHSSIRVNNLLYSMIFMSTLHEILHILWIKLRKNIQFHTWVSVHFNQVEINAYRPQARSKGLIRDDCLRPNRLICCFILYTFPVLKYLFSKLGKMK